MSDKIRLHWMPDDPGESMVMSYPIQDRAPRTFNNDEEPPLGERIAMVNDDGAQVIWTGKRWYDPDESDRSLQTQEAWPPYELGPWREVVSL